MTLSFNQAQRRDDTCQLSRGIGRSLRTDAVSAKTQPVENSQLEKISNNLSKLCHDLDIRDTEEESDPEQSRIGKDIEHVNLRSLMPIVLAPKSKVHAKKMSLPMSKTVYATPEK